MTMIRLFVKGTRAQALAAAESRGIEVTHDHTNTSGEQVLVTTSDPARGAVMRWFAAGGWRGESSGGFFPAGTLLWFRLPRAPMVETRRDDATDRRM